jgi:hypothetical protein
MMAPPDYAEIAAGESKFCLKELGLELRVATMGAGD